jgi:DNA-binding transcriptional ArsR family regulator
MATANFRTLALAQLEMTIADLRIPERRKMIVERAKALEAASRKTREGDTVRQHTVAAILNRWEGFASDPSQYGPTVAEVHAALVDSGLQIKRPAVSMHLAKLRKAGHIDSARKLEGTGSRGAPPVFFFLTTDGETWGKVCKGKLVAS